MNGAAGAPRRARRFRSAADRAARRKRRTSRADVPENADAIPGGENVVVVETCSVGPQQGSHLRRSRGRSHGARRAARHPVVTSTASAGDRCAVVQLDGLRRLRSRAGRSSWTAMPRAASARRKPSADPVVVVLQDPAAGDQGEGERRSVEARCLASASKRVRTEIRSSTPPAPPPISTMRRGPCGCATAFAQTSRTSA